MRPPPRCLTPAGEKPSALWCSGRGRWPRPTRRRPRRRRPRALEFAGSSARLRPFSARRPNIRVPREDRLDVRPDPCSFSLFHRHRGVRGAPRGKAEATRRSARTPEGGRRPVRRQGLDGWVKADGKRRPPGRSRTASCTSARARGSILTEETFGDFQLHVEFNVPYMPEAKGQARGNSGVYLGGHLRAPGPRLLRPEAPGQRLRRDLQAGRPAGQRLQAAAPVADLRHHLPQGPGRGRQGRQEGPDHRRPERRQDHRRRRDLAHPRRHRRPRRARTARSCSRTTATPSSSATSGSSRSSEAADVELGVRPCLHAPKVAPRAGRRLWDALPEPCDVLVLTDPAEPDLLRQLRRRRRSSSARATPRPS